MLILSSKIRYGTAALLELADHYGKGLLRTRTIAERRSIPPNYLEQLLSQLTKAGIVKSVRGSMGGYELAASPGEITFLEIWSALEGGAENAAPHDLEALQALYGEAESKIREVFHLPLAELARRQQERDEARQGSLMFYI